MQYLIDYVMLNFAALFMDIIMFVTKILFSGLSSYLLKNFPKKNNKISVYVTCNFLLMKHKNQSF